ncbi:hypothetical protein [Streptomyces sp. TLI_171]|uniref:hypothetical protein n=1 Tax=Streptomyces sp. TLI_171 TaxID=1938859 RepID=UPI000C5DD49C|nr:hypothetical protein [Streptomyces sp. TLI_171]RKE21881.1 hypothetical protein BX266_5287 [Streptomyces sp. TLI_171]
MTDPVNDPATADSPDSTSTTAFRTAVDQEPDDGLDIGQRAAPPHPKPVSLVGSYVYSYDLASPGRPPAPTTPAGAGRSIPNMRPSYDAEHPVSATPIYDSLYSEYRRLFRALPGDRSGEEGMRFTGFAVRDPQPREAERREAPAYPQHQAFETYAGQGSGAPQFMPAQANGQGWVASGYLGPAPQPAAGATSGGRHRSVLSLPPGRDA